MAGGDCGDPKEGQVTKIYSLNGHTPERQAQIYSLNGHTQERKAQIYSLKDDTSKLPQVDSYHVQEPQTKLLDEKETTNMKSRMPHLPDRRLILDACFTYLYIGPFTVFYWTGTWMLQLTVIFKDFQKTSDFALCAAIGWSVSILISIAQERLYEFASRRCLFWQFVIKRLYTYIVAFACVCHWRVVWEVLDEYTGISDLSASVSVAAPVFVLGLLRSLGIFLAPPAAINMDVDIKAYFAVSTYFNQRPGTVKHVLDSAFSVIILHSLMVSIWRGTWELFDLHLRPDDFEMSAIYSLIISFSMAAALLFFREHLIFLSAWLQKKHFLLKLLFEDIVLCMHFTYVVLHWRGIWILMDTHFLEPPVRYWVLHFVAFAVMNLSFAGNSIVARGIIRDGSMSQGEGLRLNIRFITSIKMWYQKKQQETRKEAYTPASTTDV